ncbi:MAG: 5-keto-L-gluconate epimerase [bacterium]
MRMKKSIAISTPKALFSALAFREDFAVSIKKVADLGYDGVEISIRNPKEIDVDGVKRLVREHGLAVPAIGTGQAYGEEGLSFSDPDGSVRRRAIERIISQVEFASNFGAQVIIGLIRGNIKEGVRREDAEAWTVEAVNRCGEAAKRAGLKLALEPINRYETNFIHTVDEGLDFIGRLDVDNVGLLMDTYHMNIEEPSIYESFRKAGEKLYHVHLADSNRWAPGYGHIDFAEVFRTLRDMGYAGFVSVEILPKPSPDTCARAAIEHLMKVEGQL